MFRIIFLILVTNALADASSSQGHIKYSDGSGTKVDWKLYAPYSQFKSQLQHYQRRDSAKSLPKQSQLIETPVEVSKIVEPRYKPFSQVPNHLKQLLTQSYEQQTPYVNPDDFLHHIPQFSSFGEVVPRKSQPIEDQSRTKSTITKPQNYQQRQQQQQEQSFGEMDEEIQQRRNQGQAIVQQVPNRQSFSFDKSVPIEIQQLLQYQAQIPYNVIANHIIYKPETPFVPEPLLEDEIGPYKYRSRVYYAVKNNMKNNKIQEHPVRENPNH